CDGSSATPAVPGRLLKSRALVRFRIAMLLSPHGRLYGIRAVEENLYDRVALGLAEISSCYFTDDSCQCQSCGHPPTNAEANNVFPRETCHPLQKLADGLGWRGRIKQSATGD